MGHRVYFAKKDRRKEERLVVKSSPANLLNEKKLEYKLEQKGDYSLCPPKKTIKKTSAEYEQEYFALIAKVDKKFEKFKITKEKEISDFKAKCEKEKAQLEKKYLPLITESYDPAFTRFAHVEPGQGNIGNYD